jgi:hypothetical protein
MVRFEVSTRFWRRDETLTDFADDLPATPKGFSEQGPEDGNYGHNTPGEKHFKEAQKI